MKKLSAVLLGLLMTFSCLATACIPGGGGGGNNEGGFTKQELSSVYLEVATQTWEKIGVELPEDDDDSHEISPFALVIPNKKVETEDEGHVHSIKYNAKDTAGIMYLLSKLYANEDYVTNNGLARFDVTYTILGTVNSQTIALNTKIDKEINMLYFEAMVETPQYNVYGYTYAEITYNFTEGTLIECRFIMSDGPSATVHDNYLDMMLTSDGRYLWYETETPDDFTAAVDQKRGEFINKYMAVDKLTANFSSEMQAYVDLTTSFNNQVPPPQQGNDPIPGPGNGDVVVDGDGEQMEKPDGGNNPSASEISEEAWTRALNFNNIEKFTVNISWNDEQQMYHSISYEVDGDKVCKWFDNGSGGMDMMFYAKDGSEYCLYTVVMGDTDKEFVRNTITESEYNEGVGKIKRDLNEVFKKDDFQFLDLYITSHCDDPEISFVTLVFDNEKLTNINCIKNGINYIIMFNYEDFELRLPM